MCGSEGSYEIERATGARPRKSMYTDLNELSRYETQRSLFYERAGI